MSGGVELLPFLCSLLFVSVCVSVCLSSFPLLVLPLLLILAKSFLLLSLYIKTIQLQRIKIKQQ